MESLQGGDHGRQEEAFPPLRRVAIPVGRRHLPPSVRGLQGEIRPLFRRLRETEELLGERDAVLDRLPTLITLMDSRLRFIWVNQAYADWYRLPKKNIIGRRVQDIIAPASFEVGERFMRSALEGQACSYENIAFGTDGKVRGVRASYFPLSDATGKVPRFVAVVEAPPRGRPSTNGTRAGPSCRPPMPRSRRCGA